MNSLSAGSQNKPNWKKCMLCGITKLRFSAYYSFALMFLLWGLYYDWRFDPTRWQCWNVPGNLCEVRPSRSLRNLKHVLRRYFLGGVCFKRNMSDLTYLSLLLVWEVTTCLLLLLLFALWSETEVTFTKPTSYYLSFQPLKLRGKNLYNVAHLRLFHMVRSCLITVPFSC